MEVRSDPRSLAKLGRNSQYFPQYQGTSAGGDLFARDCPHSHLVAGFLTLSRDLPYVVFLSDLRPEITSKRKNAASFPVYLYWAFSGVTLGKQQMVPRSAYATAKG
jgi:hypothetical protein